MYLQVRLSYPSFEKKDWIALFSSKRIQDIPFGSSFYFRFLTFPSVSSCVNANLDSRITSLKKPRVPDAVVLER